MSNALIDWLGHPPPRLIMMTMIITTFMMTTVITIMMITITFVLCFDRFALTSSSQAAGSSDCGNLLVQAWKCHDHHYGDDDDDGEDDDDGDPDMRLSQLRSSAQNGLC